MRGVKIGKHLVPLWLIGTLLISGFGIGALAYYVWDTLNIQLEIEEPLEILDYPSTLALHPGETEYFNFTVENSASVDYPVIFSFSLDNLTYQESYVAFSNQIYKVAPGAQNLTAWLSVKADAPPINATLTITFEREIYLQGLVGYWRLDEGSGTTAGDSSGNNNNGIIYGATWVDGKIEKALNFDGNDDYISIAHSPSLEFSDSVTVAGWIKIEGTTGDHQVILAKHYGDLHWSSYVLEVQQMVGLRSFVSSVPVVRDRMQFQMFLFNSVSGFT